MKNATRILAVLFVFTAITNAAVLDGFDTSHDYLTSGVAGTAWDGVLNAGEAGTLNANITNTGTLTMTLSGDNLGWDNSHANAPFLYMNMPINFDVSVQISDATTGNYLNGGILARLSDTDFMSLNYNTFDSGSSVALRSVQSGSKADYNLGVDYTFIRMQKQGASFTVFAKENEGDSWTELKSYTRTDLDHEALQVGLFYGNYSSLDGAIQFNNFSSVPEPTTMCLLGFGSLFLIRRKK